MLQNSALNFTKLYTVSPDLDLRINSTDILNISVTLHPYHITGPVKTLVIFTYGIRIFHKYGCSLLRKIMVSSCNLTACMAKLAGCTDRKPLQIFAHNIAADIPLGLSNRNVVILFIYPELCGGYGIFGRTVTIDHLIGAVPVMLEFFTAKGNKFEARSIFQQLCYQLAHLRREGSAGKLLILNAFCNSNSILPDILRKNIQ